jgi:hypothetical protein
MLEAIGIGKDFLSRTQVAQQLRKRMDKWDYIKFKSFCTTKEMVSKLNSPPTESEKIITSYTSDKGLITRIYRKLKNEAPKKINDSIKKWATELNNFFKGRSPKKNETMLTILGHKGNANQNPTKILPHPC